MQDKTAALGRLAAWFRSEALPLWTARGYDRERGGFFEALDSDGAPVADALRRVRVQARQVYVFSNVARLGWNGDAGGLARAGFDYLLAKACPDEGARGCAHLLSPEGAIIDARRDLYDQAFLLLACAGYWRAFNDRRALELATRTMDFLDRELAAPGGGYCEDDLGSHPRRQNPHMHLFEAFVALHAATGEEQWRERADAILNIFERRFFDRERGVLREFFSDDLEHPDRKQGDVVEPGHMAEWVCLLHQFQKVGGRVSGEIGTALYENTIALGCDAASGFLVDRLLLGEKAAGKTRRLWPQTEFIRASLARARAGAPDALACADKVAESLLADYIRRELKGLWCDQFDGEGRPIAKDTPASIVYHLFEVVQEIETFLGEQRS